MAVCFEYNIKNKLSFCKLISLGVKVLNLLGRCFFKTFFLIPIKYLSVFLFTYEE